MKSNKLFIYTRVSEKLITDKRGGTAAHRRVDRTSPYTFLAVCGNWQLGECNHSKFLRRSKFESCTARTKRHITWQFQQVTLDVACKTLFLSSYSPRNVDVMLKKDWSYCFLNKIAKTQSYR